MKMKYTPGPWIISDGLEIVAENGRSKIGKIYWDMDRVLCAAAPELLEALKKCRSLLIATSGPQLIGEEREEKLASINFAIAKAEGEEK